MTLLLPLNCRARPSTPATHAGVPWSVPSLPLPLASFAVVPLPFIEFPVSNQIGPRSAGQTQDQEQRNCMRESLTHDGPPSESLHYGTRMHTAAPEGRCSVVRR